MYHGLNALQQDFRDFNVLGVPCNQFGLQEPGANSSEILNSLKYVRPGGGFEPNFELTEKVDVNGKNEHPLFTYVKSYCPPANQHFKSPSRLYYDDLQVNDIRWNFEKFLINRRGKPVIRYSNKFDPVNIRDDIQQMLMATERDDLM